MDLLRRHRTNDIWAAPPGGLPPVARRSLKAPVAFGLAVTLALGGGLTYSSMRSSTAVSAEDALAEFQASEDPSTDVRAQSSDSRSKTKPQRRSTRARAATQRRPTTERKLVAASGPRSTDRGSDPQAQPQPSSKDAQQSVRQNRSARAATRVPPREGVYAWQVEGYEQAPGIRRQLPARSHRVVNHRGANSWVEHHIFSEEREQWMTLNLHEDGVTTSSVRNRVVMGPMEVDGTVAYDPPAFVARLPNRVGQTWKGSWEGKTSGSYTGRTFDHTTIVIQGEEVEVWATEVVMRMRGEVEGTAVTRSWYSPTYNMVVKQAQDLDVKSGPGNYRSEWTGQVLSVTPQT